MPLTIDDTTVGTAHSPFVIAEIGMNHNGDIELGKEMIRAAAEAGADAVKFQSFRTERFLSERVSARDEYAQYELTPEDHEILKAEAHAQDLSFLSTPFDAESVDLLDGLGVPCFKIASSDLTNYPFLEYVAEKGKPMILSTGYATFSEVAKAVETVRDGGNEELVLLHCVSTYPTPPEEMNLGAIRTLAEAFESPVGLSDHTKGSPVAPITATAFGASIIEKHFTTDNSLPGFDHEISENPETFQRMVDRIRTTHEALGMGRKVPRESELESKSSVRRSLFWESSYESGTDVTDEMILAMRPGDGIRPDQLDSISGTVLAEDVEAGEQVEFSHLEWDGE
jgi:sialic acid synthase SpsE